MNTVIGNRYGSPAIIDEKEKEYSVSMMELKTAYMKDKQVFIFIDKKVMTEYETYLLNKDKDEEIAKIIRVNHPMVGRLKELLKIPYNFYIDGTNDLKALLNARSYTSVLRTGMTTMSHWRPRRSSRKVRNCHSNN